VGFIETLLIRMVLDLLVGEGGRPQAYRVGVVGCGRVFVHFVSFCRLLVGNLCWFQ